MRVLKKGNNAKSLTQKSMVRPILEYGAAFWDPCREGQINASDRVQTKAAQLTYHTKYSDWETLAQRRAITRKYTLFKAYSGERAWKATGCEGLAILVGLIMFGKLGTGSKERITGSIPK
jgi:hypothetical protein